ncbi:hypothetical protein [Marinobacterium sedimentorum]|uniref:hypothetical protein n=1 Tax=Marinobacterium sedimentorum TaxID=2927804 RepID=UPI0020C71962|nr:hypothetical protein [Marinobacterium sedimentorum]MCP8685948.1 hypothetical protein [Marinobacterium sedimentorum]
MYSDWQLNLIRNALRMYKECERREDGKAYSWQDIHAAIADYTGYEISESQKLGAESIRKFVEGEPRKGGWRHFSKPDWVPYSVEFLTHDDVLVLTEDELDGYVNDLKAAAFLTDYLYGDRFYKTTVGTKSGSYIAKTEEKFDFVAIDLSLEGCVNPYIYEISLIENYYSRDSSERYEKWTDKEKQDERLSYFMSSGWAVHTPEDELIVYLKTADGVNETLYTATLFGDGGLLKKLPDEFVLVKAKSGHSISHYKREEKKYEGCNFTVMFTSSIHEQILLFSMVLPSNVSVIGE